MNASFSGRIHANSLEAHKEQAHVFSKRAGAVYRWILFHGPRTDREVARELGFGDNLNAVRPRITELIEDGLLVEVSDRRCPVTGRTVRVVDTHRPRQSSLFSSQETPDARSDCRSMLACGDVD